MGLLLVGIAQGGGNGQANATDRGRALPVLRRMLGNLR